MTIGELINPKPPERIYDWINTQLSIARFYGGCTFNGHSYVIDMQDPDKPLVRQDVYLADLKAAKEAQKQAAKEAKAKQSKAENKHLFD
jgi:hypothetical protein